MLDQPAPIAAVTVAAAPSGEVLFSTRLQSRVVGRRLGEVAEQLDVFRADGRKYLVSEWPISRTIRSGEEVVGEEVFHLEPDGHLARFSVDSAPLYDGDGRLVAGVAVSRDVSEEQDRQERRAFLAGLLDNTEDAVVALDANWLLTTWNQGAERMYGWTAEELVGCPITELADVLMSDQDRADAHRAATDEGRWRGEVVVRRKDGSLVSVELITVALRDERGAVTGFLSIQRDVTERRQAEQRLREAREAERRRLARDLHDEALQALADALAHATLARASAADAATRDRLAELVPALKAVSQHVRAAIHDLRLGGEEDRPVAELLADLVELQRPVAVDCEIALEIRQGAPTGPLGPPGTELLRLAREALVNARRHSGARTIRVVLGGSRQELCVEVIDDGRGIDASDAPSTSGGTGIVAMRERAELLGAGLEITSTPAAGTSVRLRLPLASAGPLTAADVRVLLVDDHAAVREAIAAMFEREAGFVVVGQVATLAEARAMLGDADLAVVDLGLPDGFGGDLIGELSAVNPRAQALVLTASLDPDDRRRAERSGAAAILNKTVEFDHLLETARALTT